MDQCTRLRRGIPTLRFDRCQQIDAWYCLSFNDVFKMPKNAAIGARNVESSVDTKCTFTKSLLHAICNGFISIFALVCIFVRRGSLRYIFATVVPYWCNRLFFIQCYHWRSFHDDVIKQKLFSALLTICAGNSPVPGEIPTQRLLTQSFDVFLSAPE